MATENCTHSNASGLRNDGEVTEWMCDECETEWSAPTIPDSEFRPTWTAGTPVKSFPSEDVSDRAEELTEAWETFRDVAWQALRDLNHSNPGAFNRIDAYFGQVIDPSSRMLGMQSIEQWVGDLAGALVGTDEEETE